MIGSRLALHKTRSLFCSWVASRSCATIYIWCLSRYQRIYGYPVDTYTGFLVPRYNLGPNGGILTALNLFTTKFDQVLDLVEKRAEGVECVDIFWLLVLVSMMQVFFEAMSYLTRLDRLRFSPGLLRALS